MLVKPCCPMETSRPLVYFHFSTTITIMSLQWVLFGHCWWASGCEMIVMGQRPERNKNHHSVRAAPSSPQSLGKTLLSQCTPQDIPWFNAASNSLVISWSPGLFHALMELFFCYKKYCPKGRGCQCPTPWSTGWAWTGALLHVRQNLTEKSYKRFHMVSTFPSSFSIVLLLRLFYKFKMSSE